MVLGLGLDLVEIGRIAKACEKPHFRARIFTPAENARIDERGAQTAAGIFAAKEAVVKALGTGFRTFMPSDIAVLREESGRPYVVLYNGAKALAEERGITHIHVSITDTQEYAQAFAVAEVRKEA